MSVAIAAFCAEPGIDSPVCGGAPIDAGTTPERDAAIATDASSAIDASSAADAGVAVSPPSAGCSCGVARARSPGALALLALLALAITARRSRW